MLLDCFAVAQLQVFTLVLPQSVDLSALLKICLIVLFFVCIGSMCCIGFIIIFASSPTDKILPDGVLIVSGCGRGRLFRQAPGPPCKDPHLPTPTHGPNEITRNGNTASLGRDDHGKKPVGSTMAETQLAATSSSDY